MPQGSAGYTIDHQEIRRWAGARDAQPVLARPAEGEPPEAPERLDFVLGDAAPPGGTTHEPISWERFFELFDERELALLYRDEERDGSTSRAFRLIPR